MESCKNSMGRSLYLYAVSPKGYMLHNLWFNMETRKLTLMCVVLCHFVICVEMYIYKTTTAVKVQSCSITVKVCLKLPPDSHPHPAHLKPWEP